MAPSKRIYLSLFLLAASTLVFEINLIRIFSIAQFYHFAFMIISIALLGYGASGSFLSIFPKIFDKQPTMSVGWLSFATGISIIFSYIIFNLVLFDSFSIFLDLKQIFILILQYLLLATPFFFSGLTIGFLLSNFPRYAAKLYAINLIGSACAGLIALISPIFFGGEGTIVISSGLAIISSLICIERNSPLKKNIFIRSSFFRYLISIILIILVCIDLISRIILNSGFKILDINISPYKSLSYTLQYPGAQIIFQKWNSFSRIDVVRSPGIRSISGLSIRYLIPPPNEDGLLIDGDDLNPILLSIPRRDLFEHLPSSIAFRLRPHANTLILEPRGGLDILTALSLDAKLVTAVEENGLIVDAGNQIYENQKVVTITESSRSYTSHNIGNFDIVIISLINSYHPVRSGAYSLAEDYRYTVEAFRDALNQLNPDGILVITRWLQNPPSESLRTFAMAIKTLEDKGLDPKKNIVSFRGYNTSTTLVKLEPFTEDELSQIYTFSAEKAFDLIYTSSLTVEQTNQYNVLPDEIYYKTFKELINTNPSDNFFDGYEFDVSPSTDNKPFFSHYFKWSQVGRVINEIGKYWQPFGGAGFLVVLALLILVLILSTLFIVLPALIISRKKSNQIVVVKPERKFQVTTSIYFCMIGLGYFLVEIPLIQKFILYLGHPAYSMTAVLATLLFFSGLGSRFCNRVNTKLALFVLAFLLIGSIIFLPVIFETTMGAPITIRFIITFASLAPIGFLMGIPFPSGIEIISKFSTNISHIPMMWAINGSASVIAAILAALLSLSYGFNFVLLLGAITYLIALIIVTHILQKSILVPRL